MGRASKRKTGRRQRMVQRFGAAHKYAKTIRKQERLGEIPEGRQVPPHRSGGGDVVPTAGANHEQFFRRRKDGIG